MTRSEIVTTVQAFMHRSFTVSEMDGFMQLAEARIASAVRAPEMVVFGSIDTASPVLFPGAWALPADYLQMRDVVVPIGSGRASAQAVGRRQIAEYTITGGPASVYSIYDGAIEIRPSPGGAVVNLIYYGRLPALVLDTDTNDLLAHYPGLYVNAVLIEGFRYEQDVEQMAASMAEFSAMVQTINLASDRAQRGPGQGTFNYNAYRGAQRWA